MSENSLRYIRYITGLLVDLTEFGTDNSQVAKNVLELNNAEVSRDELQKMILGELDGVVDPYKQRQMVAVSVKIADYLKGGKP